MTNKILDKNNACRNRFINIALENVAVAAVALPSRCRLKEGKNIDVYKTPVKLIMSIGAEARAGTNLHQP